MPQLTNMVLKDHAAADHTYAPQSSTAGLSTLVESTGVPLGDRRITIGGSTTPQGRRKVTMKLVIPIVQDSLVGGISRPTIVRVAYANLDFSFDPGSNTDERSDVRALVKSLMDNTMAAATIDSLASLY